MIKVNNNDSLTRLLMDVHCVLCEASKEFNVVRCRFDFDPRNRGVKCVRFCFEDRKSYYVNVYPFQVELFNYLDRAKQNIFCGFSYVRYSIDVFCENGIKKYSLVLWY